MEDNYGEANTENNKAELFGDNKQSTEEILQIRIDVLKSQLEAKDKELTKLREENEILSRFLDTIDKVCNSNPIIALEVECVKKLLTNRENIEKARITLREELLLFADYSESDKISQTTDECVDNYLDNKKTTK